jgi:hypothetical protein
MTNTDLEVHLFSDEKHKPLLSINSAHVLLNSYEAVLDVLMNIPLANGFFIHSYLLASPLRICVVDIITVRQPRYARTSYGYHPYKVI